MPITLGTATSFTSNTGTSFSHTVEVGSDRALFVGISFRNGSVSSVQYDGVAMTEIYQKTSPNNGTPGIALYYLINPSEGAANVTWTASGANRFGCGAVALFGVNQTTAVRTEDSNTASSATSTSVSPTSAVNDVVLDFVRTQPNGSNPSSFSADGGQTELLNDNANTGGFGISEKAGASSTTTMGWSWTESLNVEHAGVAFIPAGALSPPEGTVTIDSTDETSTTLTFTYSYDDTDETGFEYRINGGTAVDIGDPSPKEYRVFDLTPNTTYNSPGLEVRAYNADGEGDWSTAQSFTTPVAADPVFARTNETWHLQTNHNNQTMGAGSTQYMAVSSSPEGASLVAGDLDRYAGTQTDAYTAYVVVTSNGTTADSEVVLQVDGVDTDLSVTITAGTTGKFENTADTVTIGATSTIRWKVVVGTGGSILISQISCLFEPNDEDEIVTWLQPFTSGELTVEAADLYVLPFGTRASSTSEADAEYTSQLSGTLRYLQVGGGEGAGGSDGDIDFTARKNGASTSLSATFTDDPGDTSEGINPEDLSNTVSISVGDEFNWFIGPDGTSTGSARMEHLQLKFESDNTADGGGDRSGAFLLGVGRTGGFLPFDGPYFAVAGEAEDSATESDVEADVPVAIKVWRLVVRTDASSSGVGTVILRKNGADTDLTLDYDDSGGGGNTYEAPIDLSVDFDAGDTINFEADETSGTTRFQYISLVAAVRDAGGGGTTVSGGVSSQSATTQGQVDVEVSAQGSVQAEAATADGNCGLVASASGAVQAADSTAIGNVSQAGSVSGDVSAQDAGVAGQIDAIAGVQGVVQAQAAAADGSVAMAVSAQGAVVAQEAVAAGSAGVVLDVSGAVQAGASATAGVVREPGSVIRPSAPFRATPALYPAPYPYGPTKSKGS